MPKKPQAAASKIKEQLPDAVDGRKSGRRLADQAEMPLEEAAGQTGASKTAEPQSEPCGTHRESSIESVEICRTGRRGATQARLPKNAGAVPTILSSESCARTICAAAGTGTDPAFATKAADIVGQHLAPPEDAAAACVDEFMENARMQEAKRFSAVYRRDADEKRRQSRIRNAAMNAAAPFRLSASIPLQCGAEKTLIYRRRPWQDPDT